MPMFIFVAWTGLTGTWTRITRGVGRIWLRGKKKIINADIRVHFVVHGVHRTPPRVSEPGNKRQKFRHRFPIVPLGKTSNFPHNMTGSSSTVAFLWFGSINPCHLWLFLFFFYTRLVENINFFWQVLFRRKKKIFRLKIFYSLYFLVISEFRWYSRNEHVHSVW